MTDQKDKNFTQEENVSKVVDDMTLFDDELMSLVFDGNIPATELLLKIILNRSSLTVVNVIVQKELENPLVGGRNIRLDIFAKDETGECFNVEVQRQNAGADERRARFHSSMIDSRMLREGQKFKELLKSYVIMITQQDYFGCGLPVYTINRYIKETGTLFRDGSHIVYVNGSYRGNDPIGRLMRDFSCKEAEDMYYRELAIGVKHFKEGGGREMVSEVVEEYAKEYAKECAIKTTIEDAISYGMEKERILGRVNQKYGISIEEAEKLYEAYAMTAI